MWFSLSEYVSECLSVSWYLYLSKWNVCMWLCMCLSLSLYICLCVCVSVTVCVCVCVDSGVVTYWAHRNVASDTICNICGVKCILCVVMWVMYTLRLFLRSFSFCCCRGVNHFTVKRTRFLIFQRDFWLGAYEISDFLKGFPEYSRVIYPSFSSRDHIFGCSISRC